MEEFGIALKSLEDYNRCIISPYGTLTLRLGWISPPCPITSMLGGLLPNRLPTSRFHITFTFLFLNSLQKNYCIKWCTHVIMCIIVLFSSSPKYLVYSIFVPTTFHSYKLLQLRFMRGDGRQGATLVSSGAALSTMWQELCSEKKKWDSCFLGVFGYSVARDENAS